MISSIAFSYFYERRELSVIAPYRTDTTNP